MDLRLQGRAVLLVGASDGIGAATARLLVQEGAKVILVARRANVLEALAIELRAAGGDVLVLAGDARRPRVLDEIVAKSVAHYGALHRLVVVAGAMSARAPFEELSDADWDSCFQQILMVTVNACRAALPELLKHSDSAIVLTSAYSIRAQKPALIAYTAMKTAIASVSKNLAKTYGPQGLRVNCIAPGVIEKDAENRRTLAKKYAVPEDRARYEFVLREFGMRVALERAGRHEEFADLIVFLLSSRASYVTGTTVNIDGGTDF